MHWPGWIASCTANSTAAITRFRGRGGGWRCGGRQSPPLLPRRLRPLHALKDRIPWFCARRHAGRCRRDRHSAPVYTERGFLGTAGFLIALSLAGLALGIWVGAERTTPLRRWIGVIMAFVLAGIFATVWMRFNGARLAGWTGALAALFLLAEPAYTGGALFSSLTERSRSVATSALLGAAFGVLLASLLLIPRLSAGVIFGAAAVALHGGRTLGCQSGALSLDEQYDHDDEQGGADHGSGQPRTGRLRGRATLIDAGARVCITGRHEQVHANWRASWAATHWPCRLT